MADQSYVGIAPQGPGPKIQTVQNEIDEQIVEAQVVVPADEEGTPYVSFPVRVIELFVQMKDALNRLARPIFVDMTNSRARVQVDAFNATLGTVTTVTTVTTLTNQSQIGGQDAKHAYLNTVDRSAYFAGPRSRITG